MVLHSLDLRSKAQHYQVSEDLESILKNKSKQLALAIREDKKKETQCRETVDMIDPQHKKGPKIDAFAVSNCKTCQYVIFPCCCCNEFTRNRGKVRL